MVRDPPAVRHRYRLRGRDGVHRGELLHQLLRRGPRPDLPHVRNRVPVEAEQRQEALERGDVPPDHEREGAGLHLRGVTAERGVEVETAAGAHGLPETHRGVVGERGVVEEEVPGTEVLEQGCVAVGGGGGAGVGGGLGGGGGGGVHERGFIESE